MLTAFSIGIGNEIHVAVYLDFIAFAEMVCNDFRLLAEGRDHEELRFFSLGLEVIAVLCNREQRNGLLI